RPWAIARAAEDPQRSHAADEEHGVRRWVQISAQLRRQLRARGVPAGRAPRAALLRAERQRRGEGDQGAATDVAVETTLGRVTIGDLPGGRASFHDPEDLNGRE